MRNVSKNKFLLCFRPVLDIDDMLESKVVNKHEMMKTSSETKSMFSHQVSTKFTGSWIMHHPPKLTLSRAIKAVVFETILKRRAGHKNRYHHGSFGSKHSYGSKTNASQSLLSSSSSDSSSSSYSSPHASESSSLTKYYSTKEKQKKSNSEGPLKKQKKFECNGMYLILITLAFTVFWGKLFSIILTSMWLYFFSHWDSSYGCKKRFQAKDRGQFGRPARSEVYHNGH